MSLIVGGSNEMMTEEASDIQISSAMGVKFTDH